MVAKKKVAGFVRASQRKPGNTGPQVGGMTKQFAPEDDVYFHARWLPQTQIFFKFIALKSNKPAVFWQQQVLESFLSIRPWEAHPDSVRMERVPAKDTVQVLFRLGRVLEKINEMSASLNVRPTVFVRAGAEWGTGWIPRVYQRLSGESWQPEWSDLEYQMAALAGREKA